MRRVRSALGRRDRDQQEFHIAKRALLLSHSRMSGFNLVLVPGEPHRPDDALTSSFYDQQHEDADYRRNNWLLDQVEVVKTVTPRTVVEIGCGNGRFLRAVAPFARQVIGVDWARSPELVDLPDNVSVLRVDVITGAVPAGDVICSADVLEHFAPRHVDGVVSKLVNAGRFQHHVIACYDDGHTHLSILPPAAWLAIFRKYCPTACLASVDYRRRDPAQIVCIVSNLPQ
jgi:cyclopropane fatty-acyl-phospholipid synthase-like methyltransferase